MTEILAEESGIDAEERIVPCPHCGTWLDVSSYDPLQWLECFACKNSFELLRNYQDWKLLKTCDSEDGSAYFAENAQTGNPSIVRFLRAHDLKQSGSVDAFVREAMDIQARCDPEHVAGCFVEHEHGFVALVLELTTEYSQEKVFSLLGIQSVPEPRGQGAEILACPHCGQLVGNGDQVHLCAALEPSSVSGADQALVPIDDYLGLPRVASCPECGCELDVSAFDPLDLVECSSCHGCHALLKIFAEFHLLRCLEGEWQSRVCLAAGSQMIERVILVVMSSGLLAKENGKDVFLNEAIGIYSRLNLELIKNCFVDQFRGFPYFAISFHDNVREEEIAAMLESPRPEVLPMEGQTQSRVAPCPKCQMMLDVSNVDPLDEMVCQTCGSHFELFHHFGDYRLDYRLNVGGTSILYLAEDLRIGRKVALKVLSAGEMQRNPESAAIFARQFELTRSLRHPNIVEVYGGGQFHGFAYMAMELVEGFSLEELLSRVQREEEEIRKEIETAQTSKNFKPGVYDLIWPDSDQGVDRNKAGLPELVCLEIVLQAAAGLGVAHQNGLIHGDVKPENIIITYDGVVKVIDFGLVQFTNVEQHFAEGESDTIYGTPIYLPPERVRGEPEDFRSDFYSLGATLYHLMRGIAPFRAKTPSEIAEMHVKSPVVRFKAFVPTASDVVCRIVEKSMKKSVEERYGSHIEFIADLTLAKKLLLQQMRSKPETGQTLLRSFVRSYLPQKRKVNIWSRAATTAIHTYKYATMAITARLKRKQRESVDPQTVPENVSEK